MKILSFPVSFATNLKTKIRGYVLLFLCTLFLLVYSCKKGENNNLPEVETLSVTNISVAFALSGGKVIDEGETSVTARGVCWSTEQMPTIKDSLSTDSTGTGSFTSAIIGLNPGTRYYIRAYATNAGGTGYGDTISFETENYGSVTDIDGNTYNTIVIGDQTWMAENLKVIRYGNGDSIPNVKDSAQWFNLTTGAYSYYDDEPGNAIIYGNLYNWYTVADSRKLCPAGWHVPTVEEWRNLFLYLGFDSTQYSASTRMVACKVREAGIIHWESPNTGATNESGFTALPGGYRRLYVGSYARMKIVGNWWTSTLVGEMPNHLYIAIDVSTGGAVRKEDGFSIRCLKDD